MGVFENDRLESHEQLSEVAARMSRGLAELATDIRAVIESALPALREDGQNALLEASIAQNVRSMLDILAHNIEPERIEPPGAAVEYARRLAQRGVSTLTFVRAYRLGQAEFLQRLIADLVKHGPGEASAEGNATLQAVKRVGDYVDAVVEALLITYAKTRDQWLDPNAILRARVHSVLREKTLEPAVAQERIGPYDLDERHVALELWLPAASGESGVRVLRAAAGALAKAARCPKPPLFVPLDETLGCTWLPLGGRQDVDLNALTEALRSTPVFASVGECGASLEGFRRSHEQAVGAERVARASDTPRVRITPYADVASLVPLSGDLDAARVWVHETLGALALDTERDEGLRETLHVFFTNGGSYAATANALGIHRNTAQYRVQRAEELRGRPLRDGRLDVELALLACRWLGSAVLMRE